MLQFSQNAQKMQFIIELAQIWVFRSIRSIDTSLGRRGVKGGVIGVALGVLGLRRRLHMENFIRHGEFV